MKGYIVIGLMAIVLLSALAALSTRGGQSGASMGVLDVGVEEAIAKPAAKKLRGLAVFNATITSVTESSVVVESEEYSGELMAEGRWLIIVDSVKLCNWSEARGYVDEGGALIVMAVMEKGNETAHVLLGLRQEDIMLFRPILLRHAVHKRHHTRTYMSVRGVIASKGENFILLERGKAKALAIVKGKWLKAGDGEVEWSDVESEFRVGDVVRIFCHNVLVLKPWFARAFNIRAVVWGYSGAIIDLTSGTTLSRK